MNRFYADGGIVGGMDEGMLPPEAEGTGLPMEQLQSIPPEELQAIVMGAKEALEGTHPDPVNALEDFIEVFGEQELESLKEAVIQEVDGGAPVMEGDPSLMEGDPSLMSDGLSDSIPTSIDGVEPAALSEGEYVIPADAVSGLGNGDTGSGARRLEDMVGKIRSARGAAPVLPPAMDPASVMPPEGGGYKEGGREFSGGGPVKSFKYAEGGVVPSLSSGLFSLSQNVSPLNIMDPYPGGSFEVPEFVPPSESDGLFGNDFIYEPSQGRYGTGPQQRAAANADRRSARLARTEAVRDLRNDRRLERQARPVARRELRASDTAARRALRASVPSDRIERSHQRSLDRIRNRQEIEAARPVVLPVSSPSARIDHRHQRSLDRIRNRQEIEAARNGFAEGGAVPPAASPSLSSRLLAFSAQGPRGPVSDPVGMPAPYPPSSPVSAGFAPRVRADLTNPFGGVRFQPVEMPSDPEEGEPEYYRTTLSRFRDMQDNYAAIYGLKRYSNPRHRNTGRNQWTYEQEQALARLRAADPRASAGGLF